MNETKVEVEYARLLYSFCDKASLTLIPFGMMMCFVFSGYIDNAMLTCWMALIVGVAFSQRVLSKKFHQANLEKVTDHRRWVSFAVVNVFMASCVIASMSSFSARLPTNELFVINNSLMASITLFSACGFRKPLIAYATPILVSFGIAGRGYYGEYWYAGCAMLVVVLALFTIMSQYFEKTLLDSIRIRFENTELLEELVKKKDEADQANQAKSKFLAAASHDLRQPLHALGLYLDALKGLLNTPQQNVLRDKVGKSLNALNVLFDSLLDISKLDSGVIKPAIESFRVDEMLAHLRDDFEALATEKGLKIDFDVAPVVVRSDPVLLQQIVSNLLSNAIRYTAKGRVLLKVVSQNDEVILTISDTGMGIPSAELENVFAEFYQLGNPGRNRAKGLGLGLSIVRRLANLLNYEIDFQSQENIGTVVTLNVPQGVLQHNDLNKTEKSVFDLSDLKVLVIDDDEAVRDSLSIVLARWGCEVRAFGNVESALEELAQHFTPDLIVSDNRLENSMSGIEAIEIIHGKLSLPVPAILVTGDTAAERLVEVSSSEHHLLHKPVNPGLLKKTIAFATRSSVSNIS